MVKIGYHCSHEQFTPSELLRYVERAEVAGFAAAMCSDHFSPWSSRQGQSGFAWSWLGAALHSTAIPFGVVNAPGQRYHPAIIAQAAATLAEMFPDRFWLALGSGQLLNEHVTAGEWPAKNVRQQRLKECVTVMRALWAGETVSCSGLVHVRQAHLYTRPERPPLLLGAAVSIETARWVGSWADGLITVFKPVDKLGQVVDAFREGGGEGKPMYLQAQTCYAPSEGQARHDAWQQWRQSTLDSSQLPELATPQEFDRATQNVVPTDMDASVRISADLNQHLAWIQEYIELGFEAIYLHQVGGDQKRFIDAFGEHVLPGLIGL